MKFDARETARRLRSREGGCVVRRVSDAFGAGVSEDMCGRTSCGECEMAFLIALADVLDPRDTQERIDEDALKTTVEYWDCGSILCADCPAMIDGATPYERYGLNEINCSTAKTLDLLRRQRELDWRTL